MQNRFITHDLEGQRSDKWHQMRLGRITATDAVTLIANNKPGKGFETLCKLKVSQILTGVAPPDIGHLTAIEWGREHEPDMLQAFADSIELDLKEIESPDFITFTEDHDLYPFTGASPDTMTNTYDIEGKCHFNPEKHLNYLLNGSEAISMEHYAQMQFRLWINGFEFCYFVSYHPHFKFCGPTGKDLSLFTHPVERNEEMIKTIEERAYLAKERIRIINYQVMNTL